ncbi:alanine--tRNA ligase [Naumannella halotolerans]|uniref:alanine--tRNA ligase n=1 Tax=Naumannella halotolerans TaxID=993414 RepID=UPI00370DAE81
MKTADIRRTFLDFYVRNGHSEVPSAPLVHPDPTLLFVNAGMVPFKPFFTGEETAPWERATSSQKCVRTLDIEEVGKTTRHGTFFQMLGNFSFGDYFKEQAIRFAHELITTGQDEGGLGFDPADIWVTVLGPGHHPDFPDGDTEAIRYWQQVGVPTERIQGRGLEDNFWNMGVPGPGGPCSEIYIDRGPEYGVDGGPAADEDRFLEIWNLVFMSEELSAVRSKADFDIAHPLPRKNIDTGMGLERVAYLLQGVDNMYEIDEIFPVLDAAADLAGKNYGDNHDDDVQLRVVADHVRSSLMLLTDGVRPGNEAREYVLRRLLRRAVRAMRLLGVSQPVLPTLLPISKELMGASWPEVLENWESTSAAAYAEEEAFARTLAAGTQILNTEAAKVKASGADTIAGGPAFQLHDTYGFPIDLTLEMAAEQGLKVDTAAFRSLMTEQRDRAKADARAKKGLTTSTEAYRLLRADGESFFTGYSELAEETSIRGLIRDGAVVDMARPGETVEVVLAETPFYPESGGQDSDAGVLRIGGVDQKVIDVQRPVPGLIVHKIVVEGIELHAGQRVAALVDSHYRRGACMAHTATHVIHAALRETLGEGATQAGSYNRPGYLRFDFRSNQALSHDLREHIEGRSAEAIGDDFAVTATEMGLDDAKALGAMAMFGEKYGERVRMVELDGAWSRELCGGTHVAHTSQIGLLTLTGESSVGAGVRRVEALVGRDAFDRLAAERSLVMTLSDTLKVQPDQLTDRVQRMVTQLRDAEKQIAALQAEKNRAGIGSYVESAHDMWGVAFIAQQTEVAAGDLRTLTQEVRDRLGDRPGVVALIGGTQAKPTLVVAVNAGARERGLEAGKLVGIGAAELGGKGGGKPDLAQGGGTDAAKASEALKAIEYAVGHVLQS